MVFDENRPCTTSPVRDKVINLIAMSQGKTVLIFGLHIVQKHFFAGFLGGSKARIDFVVVTLRFTDYIPNKNRQSPRW
jgi:hypothetical protein